MAAKAVGRKTTLLPPSPTPIRDWKYEDDNWNPLADDGDCARMEAALRINIEWWDHEVLAVKVRLSPVTRYEKFFNHRDKNAARRRAAVRLAAELGRKMP